MFPFKVSVQHLNAALNGIMSAVQIHNLDVDLQLQFTGPFFDFKIDF